MLVLLPPSETKRDLYAAQNTATTNELAQISEKLCAMQTEAEGALEAVKNLTGRDPQITPESQLTLIKRLATPEREQAQNEQVAALQELCASPKAATATYKTLKLKPGAKAEHQLWLNTKLAHGKKAAAISVYTGVLYDALELAQLHRDGLAWIAANVAIQSALYGVIAAGEQIGSYRLSASSKLPAVGVNMKRFWQAVYAQYDWQQHGFILDLRSNDYAALAPLPEAHTLKLEFMQRQQDGTLKALNHFNKAHKGRLVHLLAASGAQLESRDDFISWAQATGIEVQKINTKVTVIADI